MFFQDDLKASATLYMESIIVTVSKDGKPYEFEAKFSSSAYTYRFIIQMNDTEIYFEPDEERNLRAIVPGGVNLTVSLKELLQLIGEQLQIIISQ